jgi:hypothetical protein
MILGVASACVELHWIPEQSITISITRNRKNADDFSLKSTVGALI